MPSKEQIFLQGVVTDAMIEELDKSDDEMLGWAEFDDAINKLMGDQGEAIASVEEE